MKSLLSLAPGFSRVLAFETSGNRFNGFRGLWKALAAATALWLVCVPASAEIYETNGLKFEVSLQMDKPTVLLGEPTWFTFRVYNHSDRPLAVKVGGDYRNDVGRPDSFKIKVVGDDGLEVPQPRITMHRGGMEGPRDLPSKGSFDFRLFLPHWATFNRAGKYSISCARVLDLTGAGAGAFPGGRIKLPVATQLVGQFEVLPPNDEQMGEIIAGVGKQMLEGRGDARYVASTTLSAFKDERVAPYFCKVAPGDNLSLMSQALWALGKLRGDEALNGLKRGMAITANDVRPLTTTAQVAADCAEGLRYSAAVSLARSPHPEAIPFLLKHQRDAGKQVRFAVAQALGVIQTPEATARLVEMATDEDERVRNEAKHYLKQRLKTN